MVRDEPSLDDHHAVFPIACTLLGANGREAESGPPPMSATPDRPVTPTPSASDYELSTDPARLDLATIHRWLAESSYWARGRPLEIVARSIQNSMSFAAYAPDGTMAAYARVVTDYATFAWIRDVFVLDAHRGRGLGKRLVAEIVAHPRLQGLRRMLLATADAHELYRVYGNFVPIAAPDRWMERFEGK